MLGMCQKNAQRRPNIIKYASDNRAEYYICKCFLLHLAELITEMKKMCFKQKINKTKIDNKIVSCVFKNLLKAEKKSIKNLLIKTYLACINERKRRTIISSKLEIITSMYCAECSE